MTVLFRELIDIHSSLNISFKLSLKTRWQTFLDSLGQLSSSHTTVYSSTAPDASHVFSIRMIVNIHFSSENIVGVNMVLDFD